VPPLEPVVDAPLLEPVVDAPLLVPVVDAPLLEADVAPVPLVPAPPLAPWLPAEFPPPEEPPLSS
ncbi:MAG: hypothetical protein WBY94_12270, partial [Polyangiaceae bacterium]